MSPDFALLNRVCGRSTDAQGICDFVCGQSIFKKHPLRGEDFFPVEPYGTFKSIRVFRALMLLVRAAKNDLTNCVIANWKHLHKFAYLRASRVQSDNFLDLFCGQLGAWSVASGQARLESGIKSVLDVLRTCDPLKIFNRVIGFNPVEVVDFVLVRWAWPQKSKSDQRMQSFSYGLVSRLCEDDSLVAFAHGDRNQNPVLYAFGRARQPLDPTNRTNGVETFPPWDFPPLFSHLFKSSFTSYSLPTFLGAST